MQKNEDVRPISPHLSIHKRLQTAILSILHRITGFGLNIGIILVVIWIAFIAMGEKYYNILYSMIDNVFVKTIYFVWAFSLFFHLVNGIRYLIWSAGFGIDIKDVNRSGYLVIVFSLFLTILVWTII